MRKNNYIYSLNSRLPGRLQYYNFAYRARLNVIFYLIIILIVCVIICGFQLIVSYADEASDEIALNISELLSQLDLSGLQSYIEEYASDYLLGYGDTAEEIISYLISGDTAVDYGSYINELLSILFDNVISLFPAFAQITVIAIISAVAANAEGGLISGGTAKIVRLVCTAFIVLLLAAMLYGIAESCVECVQSICTQVEVITPMLITLTVLTGGTSSAAIYQPSAIFLMNGAVELVCEFIVPAVIVCCILNFTSHLNPEMSFTGISKLIKSIIKWVIGITVAVFSIFLTVQGTSASLFDGIFYKAAKYVVGNSVPIVGGFIAGGIDTLTSAGLLIKNSVGFCGIILLLLEISEPLISLVAFSLMLKFMSAIVQPIGESDLHSMFGEIASDVEHLIAGLVMVAFMYVLVIMMIINSANSFL